MLGLLGMDFIMNPTRRLKAFIWRIIALGFRLLLYLV